MKIIINDKNIKEEEIIEIKEKVRSLILTDDNKLLIANYAGVILLPGGKIDNNESVKKALIRELQEELGIIYTEEELEYLLTLEYYQDNYPKVNSNNINRKVTTYYYLTKFKSIVNDNQILSEREKNNNFYLELISLEELKERLNKENNNPRSYYFNRELNLVIDNYLVIFVVKELSVQIRRIIYNKMRYDFLIG